MKVEGKVIPLQAYWGPNGYGRLRLADSVKSALEGGICQPYTPAVFTLRIILVLIFRG
jgi:hypothetical protein